VTTDRRLADWAQAGLIAGGAQAAVQLLGFVAGIVVIRNLAPQQYALYTITTAALGTMTVLTDGGVSSGVLAQGGAVWHDARKLGAVLATGLELRRRLALIALGVSLPLTSELLHHQGAGWLEAGVVAASILPVFLATVTSQLLEVVPRLHQRVWPLQRIQLLSNLARVVLLGLATPLWPLAAVASVATAPSQWWANWQLRRLAGRYADWCGASEADVRSRLITQVRRTMPAAVYYSLSGQLTVWVISIFGRPTAVAAVGALGRLAMILTVMSSAFGVLAVPRFARIPGLERSRVAFRYWQSQAVLALASGIPLLAIAWFPGPALTVLGPHYAGLEREALLMGFSSVASILSGAAFSLGAARGIVVPPFFALPYCILLQVCFLAVLPIDSIPGVIWVGILTGLSQWILHVVYFQWTYQRAMKQ
jgi:O-antigen/teichoic acid export membrane protein